MVLLLYCGVSVYGMATSRAMRVIWDGCSVLLSYPHLSTTFGNPVIIVQSVGGTGEKGFPHTFLSLFPPSGQSQKFLRVFNFPQMLSTQCT